MFYTLKGALLITTSVATVTVGTGAIGYFLYTHYINTQPEVSVDLEGKEETDNTNIDGNVETIVDVSTSTTEDAGRLQATLASLKTSVVEKNQSLTESHSAKDTLTVMLAENDKKIKQLTTSVAGYASTISTKTEEQRVLLDAIATENTKLTAAKTALSVAGETFKQTQSALSTALTQKEQAITDRDTQQNKLTKATEATTTALQNKTDHRAGITDLQRRIKSARRPIADGLKLQLKALQDLSPRINNAYTTAVAAETTATSELATLQQAVEQKESAYNLAVEAHDASIQPQTDANTLKSKLEAKIETLTNEKSALVPVISAATLAKTDVEQKITAEKTAKKQREEQIAIKDQLIESLNTEITELQEQIDGLLVA